MSLSRIAKILKAAGMGLMPEVNSAIQIRALLECAGMSFDQNPRVDVSRTRKGTRYRVHVDGHHPMVPSEIGTATTDSISRQLIQAGVTDVLVDRIETGEHHPLHSLANLSDGRGVGQPAFFIEFYS